MITTVELCTQLHFLNQVGMEEIGDDYTQAMIGTRHLGFYTCYILRNPPITADHCATNDDV